MKRHLVALLGISLILSASGAEGVDKDSYRLKILHFNDHHGHLDSTSMKLDMEGVGKTYVKIGGLPRMAKLISELRSDRTVVLSAGDAFSGTLYHTLFKGQANVELLNLMDIDAFSLGNHEFDNGDEVLKKFIDKANFPIVSANVEAKKGSLLDGAWKPYVIKDIKGQKVGIIGLNIAQKTAISSSPSKDIAFYDEIQRTQRYVDELTKKGIDKIILLSHFGYDNDIELVSKVNGVDVVIDGDSHTLMGDFSAVGLKSNVKEYPKKVTDKDGNTVCIAQAWEYAKMLGELDVIFNKKGKVVKCSGTSYLMLADSFRQKNSDKKKVEVNTTIRAKIDTIINANKNLRVVGEDEKVANKFAEYKKLVDKQKNQKIGTASENLAHARIPNHTYNGVNLPLGSDIAPVVAKAFYMESKRADICIQNAGGVRTGIQSGDITYGTAYTLLPFSNTLYEIDMKGSEIKQVLEDAIINWKDNKGSSGSFPYAYGLKFDIDLTKPIGDRTSNIEVMDRKTKAWSPMDMSKTYVVVTNSYIAAGRDGYTTFKEVQKNGAYAVDTYLDYAESFVNYVESLDREGRSLTKLPQSEHCFKSFKE